MNKRITSFDPFQMAKVLGIVYGLLALLVLPIFFAIFAITGVMSQAHGANGPPLVMMLAMGIAAAVAAPIFYAVMGFVTGLIGAVVYNLVARWVGGIQFQLD